MSPLAAAIQNDINTYIRNTPLDAFAELNLNRILLNMLFLADGSGGGGGQSGAIIPLTSVNFVNDTDCPLGFLQGTNLSVYWQEQGRFLLPDAGEVAMLPGGGFQVLIPGFNRNNDNYHFYVLIDNS